MEESRCPLEISRTPGNVARAMLRVPMSRRRGPSVSGRRAGALEFWASRRRHPLTTMRALVLGIAVSALVVSPALAKGGAAVGAMEGVVVAEPPPAVTAPAKALSGTPVAPAPTTRSEPDVARRFPRPVVNIGPRRQPNGYPLRRRGRLLRRVESLPVRGRSGLFRPRPATTRRAIARRTEIGSIC